LIIKITSGTTNISTVGIWWRHSVMSWFLL
jgi:hypothetical protein